MKPLYVARQNVGCVPTRRFLEPLQTIDICTVEYIFSAHQYTTLTKLSSPSHHPALSRTLILADLLAPTPEHVQALLPAALLHKHVTQLLNPEVVLVGGNETNPLPSGWDAAELQTLLGNMAKVQKPLKRS